MQPFELRTLRAAGERAELLAAETRVDEAVGPQYAKRYRELQGYRPEPAPARATPVTG